MTINDEMAARMSYNPFDIVSDKDRNVGVIQEVSILQGIPQYAVYWFFGNNPKHAWFHQEELHRHCNLFEVIAKMACHPSGDSGRNVEILFDNWTSDREQNKLIE